MGASMTEHSAWRLALAREIALAYAAHPQIRAVFVHGSVGRGWADEHSDIEMACVWSEEPSPQVSRATAQALGAADWEWGSYEESRQAWHEQFLYRGMKVELGHWTHRAIDGIILDVTERYDTTQHWLMFHKQATVSVLQHGVVLHGAKLMSEWRQQIAHYPEELAVAMVEKHLQFGPFGSREMLAKRDEIPLLYENNCGIVRRLLFSLYGLNRIYYPGFKWTRRHVEEMSIKPHDFFPRLLRVFQSDCVSGTRELRQLVEETFDLVEEHLPQVNLAPLREAFELPYQAWELPSDDQLWNHQ